VYLSNPCRERKPAARIEAARLRLLAQRIHKLGPYPLCHLFAELADGAPLGPRLEAYAALALRGNLLPQLHVVGGRR
jgi:hypothetical protein